MEQGRFADALVAAGQLAGLAVSPDLAAQGASLEALLHVVTGDMATLIEPVRGPSGLLGFLRLRYSLHYLQDRNHDVWQIFGLALLSAYALLAGLLNLLLYRFVLRPVETLRQALDSVESGRLDACVPVTSRDAIGRLAAAFNAMPTGT